MPLSEADNLRILFTMFNGQEDFFLPNAEHLSLVLIAGGKAKIEVNDETAELMAPCIFLSSCNDKIVLLESYQLAAKSLSFHPTLVNKGFTSEGLDNNDFDEIADQHDYNLINLFLSQCENKGPVNPLPQIYLSISELFDLARKEDKIKSSQTWLHRVRRYLMQILFLLEDINPDDSDNLSEETIVDIILEHIHTNYANEISLDSLCKLVYVNRTSLTRIFRARTRRSPIDYLLHYRLNMACKLLANSKLSVGKIAEATGFNYESYFTRQFTAKIGITPTRYRQSDGFEILDIKGLHITDEI